MPFIGREKELSTLGKYYQKDGFQMVVMYGRRRVGKTTILNEFTKNRNTVFFMATRTTSEMNLKELSAEVGKKLNLQNLNFMSYADVFRTIGEISGKGRLIVVFDEYPYLMESEKGISSILQKAIDRDWSHRNIMLILCGSSISMMEDAVLSEKSPLYGRRTAQMDIRPFDYRTSAAFVENYSPEDKAICYGITGGIPKYLSMIDPERSLDENIENLFFDDAGYFFEEPENLLQQEFRNVASYNSVLTAVAGGAVSVSEISQKTHLEMPLISQMLHRLIRVRIIRRDTPVPPSGNKRYVQYVLGDGMFRFWYRYVARAVNAIERGNGPMYYRQAVRPALHDYMGLEFESMCREYLWNHAADLSGELVLTNVGKWRGNDNVKKEPADIDVVGIDDTSKRAVIGECKFKNENIGARELAVLKDRARLIRPYDVREFYLFSLSGFYPGLADEKNVRCVSLRDMYF